MTWVFEVHKLSTINHVSNLNMVGSWKSFAPALYMYEYNCNELNSEFRQTQSIEDDMKVLADEEFNGAG